MNLRAQTSWGDLAKQFDKMSGRSNEKEIDPRFFVPGKDKEGNIAATIRFLPSPDSPAVLEKSSHFIKGEHGNYTEACPKAYGKPCPVCSFAGKAWGDGDKNAYKKWGNKSKYITNIVCINDINNPDNNGKVFLFEIGATIYKQIDAKVNPQNKLSQPSIVFDYKNGENYNLIGKKDIFKEPLSGKTIEYDNYKDASGFAGKSALTDEEIVEYDSKLHDMKEWLPDNVIKPFDELKTKFEAIMGIGSEPAKSSAPAGTTSASNSSDTDSDYDAINKLMNSSSSAYSSSDMSTDEADLLSRLESIRG
jgi:hypothetical protein